MTLNRTNWEHAGIASAMQFLLTCGFCLAGLPTLPVILLAALPGLFFFFGRELAQREQALQKQYGLSSLTWSITLEALRFWEWNWDSKMDFFLPLAAGMLQLLTWLVWTG